jgi:hypothetical protein
MAVIFFGNNKHLSPIHLAYNPYFSAYFFSWNSVFLSQQISQQCFSAGLSAQPNGALILDKSENSLSFHELEKARPQTK